MNLRISRPHCAAAFAAMLAVALPSCGGPSGEVTVYPVKGRVVYKGKPLSEALVVLHPVEPIKENAPPLPSGRTDEQGNFQLRTYFGTDGAPAGSYRVAISMAKPFQENTTLSTKYVKPAEQVKLDTRYNDPAGSGLKVEIKPGENQIPALELK